MNLVKDFIKSGQAKEADSRHERQETPDTRDVIPTDECKVNYRERIGLNLV